MIIGGVFMRVLRRISRMLSDLFGLNLFSDDFLVFTGSYAFFLIGNTFSSIFISTFLFQITKDINTIAVFYLIFFICEMVTAYIALRFSHRISSVMYIVIGLLLHAFGYTLLLLFRDKTVYYYPLIALVISAGGGLYYSAHINSFQLYTISSNRQAAIATHGFFVNIIALTVPMVSGLIIIKTPGIAGYMLIFGISLAFFVFAIINILRLKNIKKSKLRLRIIPFLRESAPLKVVKYIIAGQLFIGLRQGINSFYFNILIFAMTSNEFTLGLKNMLAGAASIVAYFTIRKLRLSRRNRLIMMFSGALISIFLTSSLLVWTTAVAVIIFCVFDAVALIMLSLPSDHINYDIAVYCSVNRDTREEHTAVRLMSVEMGRVVGVLFSFLIPKDTHSIIIFFIVLGTMNLVASYLYKKASDACEGYLKLQDDEISEANNHVG